MVIIMRETKSKKIAPKPKKEDNNMKNTEIEKALEKNNEEWMKRMLLLVITMIIAFLGID